MSRRAAQLLKVELTRPPRVIGKNTVESLQSGIIYGFPGMAAPLVRERSVQVRQWARTRPHFRQHRRYRSARPVPSPRPTSEPRPRPRRGAGVRADFRGGLLRAARISAHQRYSGAWWHKEYLHLLCCAPPGPATRQRPWTAPYSRIDLTAPHVTSFWNLPSGSRKALLSRSASK
jgi:Type III pantothenate kinase